MHATLSTLAFQKKRGQGDHLRCRLNLLMSIHFCSIYNSKLCDKAYPSMGFSQIEYITIIIFKDESWIP